ncbi:hypothetical protein GCM10009754_11820 [Amycolatopsis minnesotensis]|uniref:Uncharacterized protein n=1 Tax=Amycolatopsis minnesotensis TaxID=337894 RepID=A0ABN2Q6G8_9PSEU
MDVGRADAGDRERQRAEKAVFGHRGGSGGWSIHGVLPPKFFAKGRLNTLWSHSLRIAGKRYRALKN